MIRNRIKEYRAKYDMKQEDLAKLVERRLETLRRANIIPHWFWHGISQRYSMFRSKRFLL